MISCRIAIYLVLCSVAGVAYAEGGCPPGQYPIGGQGAAGCAPIPQSGSVEQQAPRPSGRWVKTWGAIAIGAIDSITSYGVTTGKPSKFDAESDALKRCSSHGEKNCRIALSYKNQCAAVAAPFVGDKTVVNGFSEFAGSATIENASERAMAGCQKGNKEAQGMSCKVVYSACTEPIFERY
ncbi:DUF4189 domain-containing protein [Xanthomonas sontii]|uniref:DUF4189 domain-containing protein n=1 Tax=Xanthomonas sontii TaxID=2650745 RepID=UPI0011E4B791|nr:DUF4189 domain-containing protein [Xanthomonas sontii]MDQ7759096.1 DUF4189 domain-containing protein [Xanthomonas sontii]TYD34617.1 hypothetical protein CEK63_11170 [Xanthomonas sontii]UZK08069.1 DUF4189 domain-containing protein [Xanthomonas sontii]